MTPLRQKVEALIKQYCYGGLMAKAPSRKGLQLVARCPFHKDGKEENPSLYWNTRNGMWHCQSCKAGGTFPKFLHNVGIHPDVVKTILEEVDYVSELTLADDPFRRNPLSMYYALEESWMTVFRAVGCPLEGTPFNRTRTMTAETLNHFEVGFDPFRREVMFPVRAWNGTLTGFSGRAHGWDRKSRYLFRTKQLEAEYPDYYFDKSFHLWNFHNIWRWSHTIPDIDKEPPPILLVEGFKVAMYLHQLGYPFVVSAYGSTLHDVQKYLLSLLGWPVIIFFDNDKAGHKGTQRARKMLRDSQCLYYSVNYYPGSEGLSPDDLNRLTIYHMLEETYDGVFERHERWGDHAVVGQPQEKPGVHSTPSPSQGVCTPDSSLLGAQLRAQ